jgi:hypothetical protein
MHVSKTVLFAITVVPTVVFNTLVTYTTEVSISVVRIVEVEGTAVIVEVTLVGLSHV